MASIDRYFKKWDQIKFIIKGKQIWKTTETENQIFALDYFYDGKTFASAGKDAKVIYHFFILKYMQIKKFSYKNCYSALIN